MMRMFVISELKLMYACFLGIIFTVISYKNIFVFTFKQKCIFSYYNCFIVGALLCHWPLKYWQYITFASVWEFDGIDALRKRWRPQLKNHLFVKWTQNGAIFFSDLLNDTICRPGSNSPLLCLCLFYITPVSITQMWI